MIQPRPVWDFSDPAASEQRFADEAAHDEAAHDEAADEAGVRIVLERGRLLRSAGDPEGSRPLFERAIAMAGEAGFEELELDARHMQALVAPPDQSDRLHREAIVRAGVATDPAARNWDASLLNNLGMNLADRGDFDHALPVFEQALAARRRIGDPEAIRVARWMVAWTLRNLGRRDEALEIQRELKEQLDAEGGDDRYVDEELALLT
ncbi:tetratricopeptide repeat protein [Aestuariimicrobium soli]|uniref:tetratricopeptide repeat protein n=1 Tax=Aestuariimicrobium soli TaxID=2035834 RepID=UPI003EBCE7E6